jgi:hypothetical protein
MAILDRNYVPAPAIYFSNSATGKYRFLIPMDYAVDCYIGDALVCDSSGNPKAGYNCPVPRPASDFGVKFSSLTM